MSEISNIYDYLRLNAVELGERILSSYPALHQPGDPPFPLLDHLLRRPFPAQSLAIMGVAKRWRYARSASVVAECGTGKTLISLAAMYVHSGGRPFTALAMVPPHLVAKWSREALNTLPGIRVFHIDSLRNGDSGGSPQGVSEVRRRGEKSFMKDCTHRSRSCGCPHNIGRRKSGGAACVRDPRCLSSVANAPSSDTSGGTRT